MGVTARKRYCNPQGLRKKRVALGPKNEIVDLIRTTYRTPPITHLRLRLELASRRTRRAIEERRRAIRAGATARKAAQNDYLRVRWQAELSRERALFEEFFDHYDALVGLVCLAAQEGVETWQEEKFSQQRSWFVAHYERAQRHISPRLSSSGDTGDKPADARRATPWERRKGGTDIFETLFRPASISHLLAGDNGALIGVLTSAQEALTAWDRDLERREKAAK